MPTNTQRRTTRRASLSLPLAGALLAVTAGSALAQSPSTAPIGAIDHPTGSTDIVLSMEVGGGFVPFGYAMTQAPTFVLYGDNTVIFRPGSAAEGEMFPPFVQAELSPDQVDALLTYALSVGKLASAGDSYVDMQVSDAPTTVFTIDAGGVDKAVSIYALGITEPTGADAAYYDAFGELATLLSTFETQVAKGNVLSAEAYQPEQYRVVLSEVDPSMSVESVTWPWADLTLDDFAPFADNPSWRLAGLTPDQLSAITTVPSGGGTEAYVVSPDGSVTFQVFWRPLLPGEDLQPTVTGGKGF